MSHVPWWKQIRYILLVLIIAVVGTVGGVFAYLTVSYPGLFSTIGASPLACPSGATASVPQVTLVISTQGFNNSRYAASCPLLNISKGQSVTIHLANNDREMHGIAVTHYFAGGVQVQPGETRDITFTADQAGSFVIYCMTGCFSHGYMQNGRLTVTG